MTAPVLVRRLRIDGCPVQAATVTGLMVRIAALEGALDPVARVEAEIAAATWTGTPSAGKDSA